MTSEKGCRKDKNQNIQVFVRLRPLNQRERDLKSIGVVDVHNGKEVVVKFSQQTNITKKFTFDKAFGPSATQVEVYQEVVSPLIEEVLAGYNCTVFAYGQTGTGKTHTMVGEHTTDESCWQKDPLAGIIPRALSQLFDELRISNTEYTVRVSYLELYNEELVDLLSTSEDNSKLRIYEDVTRKGSNIVNGLEEITVYNKKEVYRIMAQGQERKRVASTLMNAQSSRSHTVFTIVIHMKENSPEGEELMKIGKLNLVDLAGSENISKAGSDNPGKKERARECVNINQSLLTLGRVITALVERHPHVPYRESKLTRILQESLGGRTKTSIIATISPGHKDLEETLSTLEYAHRAKNIQNKPEVNQKMTKKAILKEYVEEIDRLKRDLQAARDKTGVFLANETFAEMTLKEEEQKKEIQELLLKKRAMEEERDKMEGVFSELNQVLKSRDMELNKTKNKLNFTKKQLSDTNNVLLSTRVQCEEQQQLVQHHGATEQVLTAQARELLATAEVATEHVACLQDNVDKRRSLETSNLEVTRSYREESSHQREHIAAGVQNFSESVRNKLDELEAVLENYVTISSTIQGENKQKLYGMVKCITEAMTETKSASSECIVKQSEVMENHKAQLEETLDSHQAELKNAIGALLQRICASVQAAEEVDVKGSIARFVEHWYSGAAARVFSVRRAQAEFESRLRSAEAERSAAARARHETRRAHAQLLADTVQTSIAQVTTEKEEIEKRLLKRIEDIEADRREAEARLDEWADEKRRLLEEELANHIGREKVILETRLKKRMDEIQEERALLEETMSNHIKMQQRQYEMYKTEMETADRDEEANNHLREQSEAFVNKYGKMFDEGTSAISTDMEVFSRNVVEVVEHVNNELIKTLLQAKDHIESEAKSLVESEEARCVRLGSTTGDALRDLLQLSTELNQHTIDKIEANSTATVQDLNAVAASTTSLISDNEAHRAAHSAALGHIREQVRGLHSALSEAVERQAELEGRYLARDYRLYSPTGKTPSRTEYRYPRTLAATSPHDRILARFRAMRRRNSHVDDCITLESSDTEVGCGSDCESSLSEDSAVFAAPSPPSIDMPPPTAFVKSTSESDIYAFRKIQDQQRGKENNTSNSVSKKPSKLPSLSAHKKPLVERNGTAN